MTFKIKRIQKRPSTDILFFHETNLISNDYEVYFAKNYRETKKIISFFKELSDDKLTVTTIIEWQSEDALVEFLNDPFCQEKYLKISAEYELQNNVKTEIYTEKFYKPTWKQINSVDYFKNIEIPEDWNNLEDFVDWYIDQRMPMMIPWNAKVMRSDDAVAICVFRKGHYQVEFYLEYPKMYIRKHSHPRMEVITMELGGGNLYPPNQLNLSMNWGFINSKLINGNYHGGDIQTSNGDGFVTLAFQRWEDPNEMTSASVQWRGELQGPIQAELIKSYYPDSYIVDSYADVSRKNKL